MIDPSDTQIQTYREGDAEELPTPTGGEWGEEPVGDVSVKDTAIRMAAIYQVDVPIAEERQVRASDRPDYWSVSLSTTATGAVSIWPYESPGGPAIRLEPGGEAVMAGESQSMYVRNTGPIVAKLNIMAVRGHVGLRSRWGG